MPDVAPALRFRSLLAAGALAALVLSAACADDESATTGDPSTSTSTTTSSSSGGGSGTTSSSSASTTTTSTSSGQGGAGGQVEPIEGAPGSDLVNAGTVMNSPNHRLVFTLGQSSPIQQKIQSPGHELRGGLNGATE